MAVIFWEGLIIALLVLTNVRIAVFRAIPLSLKRVIGVGIGLFIALIGATQAGLVKPGPAGMPITVDLDLGVILETALWPAIFAIMLADFFDTMGTMVSVAGEVGLLSETGEVPKGNQVLLVDSPAATPALIVVGFFLITIVKDVPWDITRGIGYGFVLYTVLMVLSGRLRQVHPLMYVVSIAFAISFAFVRII